MDETDLQLQLKKRARRRLVGAVAFVSIAAVVLPTVMDHEPRPVVQEVEIRIPGQDEKPFTPRLVAENSNKKLPPQPAEINLPPVEPDSATPPAPVKLPTDLKKESKEEKLLPTAVVQETTRRGERSEKSPEDKPQPKLEDKLSEKQQEKPKSEKTASEKSRDEKQKEDVKAREKTQQAEAKRAAAILGGQAESGASTTANNSPAVKGGSYQILIGAFSNEGNVKVLKAKLSEMDIKVMTESLDTPQGKKTRVRAGPFASKDAAEKALAKMQKIGVSGVVAAR